MVGEAVEGGGGGLIGGEVDHQPQLVGVGQLQALVRQPQLPHLWVCPPLDAGTRGQCGRALEPVYVPDQVRRATELFDAYFRDGVNIADHTQLTELAERVGLDGGRVRDFLAPEEGAAEVREQMAAARREGIATLPRFVFDNGGVIVGVTSTEALGDALRKASGR
jgi:hypothetical protein